MNFGHMGFDPRLMQAGMGHARNTGHGQPQLVPQVQPAPVARANLGFPSMPGQQATPGLQPQAPHQQMAQMGQQFGQGWQGAPAEPTNQPGWWGQNQGNVANALWAMQGMF